MSRKVFDFPSYVKIQRVGKFQTMSAATGSSSPFTGHQRIGMSLFDQWEVEITLTPMNEDNFLRFRAFINKLDGMKNVIRLHDITAQYPRGKAAGYNKDTLSGDGEPFSDDELFDDGTGFTPQGGSWTARVGKTHQSREQQIHITGLVANETAFLAGDKFQIGHRLFEVSDDVKSDANGETLVTVRPRVKEVIPQGSIVQFHKPSGLLRPTQKAVVAVNNDHTSEALTLSFQEAI